MAVMKDMKPLSDYLHALEKELAAGNTTEHSHRPALKTLMQALDTAIIATNEPQHITGVGAVDFRIVRNNLATGYVECKDIGYNLDEALNTEQLQRYLNAYHNLVLTNYLEFRWFADGKHRMTVWLGEATNNKVKPEKDGIEKTAELLNSFLKHEPEPINNPRELAQHMARLAHLIGFIINNTLKPELTTGSLFAQLTAFRENLIPDLSVSQFADMYAQTIAYGLFAARCETNKSKDFSRQNAAYLIPKTNPFLRKLFNHIAGVELDERLVGAVDDLAQILANAEIEAILEGFGKATGKDDPVVHFYETFLKEYNPKTREMRGVYYTPLPVVSYIVRSIDHILKTHFGKYQGLADPSVLVLDPAVGTATFLYEVIGEIHDAIIRQGQAGMWDNYVAEKLLPRLFGFELLMAPYAIAHLKLGRLLKEKGYQFQTDQRLGIYLTNTLEEAFKKSEQLAGFNEYIVEEANTAAEIKNTKPIMVVLGNPPYSVSSLNRGHWIGILLEDYKKDLNEKKLNLDDDYIKFIRFAQWRIDKTGYGILGFITNNSYLDGLTHRRMRECLLESFSSIYILNLHGSSRRGEQTPDNLKDKNVFDIQQGVVIGLFIKQPENVGKRQVYYSDIWGPRESKYKTLFEIDIASTDWNELSPASPNFFFVPKDFSFEDEYEQMPSLKDIFTIWQSALNTDRDELFLDSESGELKKRIQLFFSKKYTEDFKERYRVYSSSSYDIEARRERTKFAETNIRRCLHRPFDECFIYYDPRLTSRPVYEVMRHMLQSNIALISSRQTKEDFGILTTTNLSTHKIVTVYDRSFVFPLYLYPTEGEMEFEKGRRPNLNPDFTEAFSEKLGLRFEPISPSPQPSPLKGEGEDGIFTPEDVFNYAYAIFHSPTYRTRYAEFLKIDFPRLPLTSDKTLFKALAQKGAELVALHLMESAALNTPIVKFSEEKGSNEVEKVSYDEKNRRVYINRTQYLEGVPPEVWNFHIGGYQVCEKWLKDRKGRTLSYDDVAHYQKIVVALKETNRLMSEIDALILEWPIT